MYSFKNDYSEGAHPKILEAMIKDNLVQQEGYGLDDITQSAINKIQSHLTTAVDIHLISGGTQTNLIAISAMLKPFEACVAVESGHIAVHETGAIERTGHKVITVPSKDGKITTTAISDVLSCHTNEHSVKPKLVYISNPTEVGTVYSHEELKQLKLFCETHDLYLYLDGARLGAALVVESAHLTLDNLAASTDAFFIGGTKHGAFLGEALVIVRDELKKDMRYHIKQRGALLAKGRLLGLQFDTLFTDDLYLKLSKHAVDMAQYLKRALAKKGYPCLYDSPTNQIFPILPHQQIKVLEKHFDFYPWQVFKDKTAIRLVTSFATTREAIDSLIDKI